VEGLKEIFEPIDRLLALNLGSFVVQVGYNSDEIRTKRKTAGIEGLMGVWTIRLEEIERDCYNSLEKNQR
jgi:hypothetical protein